MNLRAIAHPDAAGGDVNADSLIKAGLIRDLSRDLKILGDLGIRTQREVGRERGPCL